MQNLGGGVGVNKVHYGLCESSENTLTLPNLYCKDDLSQDLGKSIAQECKKSTSGWRVSLINVFTQAP